MKQQEFLKVIQEKHLDDTVYILSRPNGVSVNIMVDGDDMTYSIIGDDLKYDEAIFTDSNRPLQKFIDLLKHMYFPMVNFISINGILRNDFYPINNDNFYDNFIITDINLGDEKRVYGSVDDVIVGGSKFQEPNILYIGTGKTYLENSSLFSNNYGMYAVCVGGGQSVKYSLED